MQVTVNGEARSLPAGLTVAGLLEELSLPLRKVAVERNLEIVPCSTFGDATLSEGDEIEIVAFVGGG